MLALGLDTLLPLGDASLLLLGLLTTDSQGGGGPRVLVCELVRAGKAASEGGLVQALGAGEPILTPCRVAPYHPALMCKLHENMSCWECSFPFFCYDHSRGT